MSTEKPETPGVAPAGTIPQESVPIKVMEQRIPCESPEAAEEIIRTLALHEGDAIVKNGEMWIYKRTRVFVDWEKVKKLIEQHQQEEKEQKTSGLVGPGGEPLPPAQPELPFPEGPNVG